MLGYQNVWRLWFFILTVNFQLGCSDCYRLIGMFSFKKTEKEKRKGRLYFAYLNYCRSIILSINLLNLTIFITNYWFCYSLLQIVNKVGGKIKNLQRVNLEMATGQFGTVLESPSLNPILKFISIPISVPA